jgi:predicted ATPase
MHMIKSLTVERFKSLVKLKLGLGRVNLFIGANGSGKSNLLEAMGVLGAAAFGRVDDETLQRRGVRPGVPKLYKTAFSMGSAVPHVTFGAESDAGAELMVSLWNPLKNPSPAWRFKTERLSRGPNKNDRVVTRTTSSAGKHNQEQGLAALEIVKLKPGDQALSLMSQLREFSIYCPNTPSLRGLIQDMQTREPVGLSGGRLPEAIEELTAAARRDASLAALLDEVRALIDWAADFSAQPSLGVPLSPSAARSRLVIQFVDRYMAGGKNRLTGYDASEGALYILYCAVLALHPKSPRCLAIDNVDQALNPRLIQRLMSALCSWILRANYGRQWLLTAHNPAILDGLPLDNHEVRLFTVGRTSQGHTDVRAIDLAEVVRKRPDESWSLSRMWTTGLLGGIPNV